MKAAASRGERLTRRGLLAAAAALLPMRRLRAGFVAHRITVIYMNDFHSRHEPVDARALACRPGAPAADCLGGAAHLATAIRRIRADAAAAGRAVLLLDAGDQFQGSLFYTAWHGDAELAVMHELGTEAMAVGNHEFDNGPANLARFVRAARFPVLSANVDASREPALAGLLRPWTMLHKDGLAIAVVGLTTLETPVGSSPGANVRFDDPAAALAREAAQARAIGASFVIALSHLGVAEDRALAGTVPGVDLILGGHSHTLLSDSERGGAGPAHQAITGPAGTSLVLQAACFGRYVGRLDLDVSAEGEMLAYGGDCTHVGLDLPPDPQVAGIVAGYAAQLDSVRRRVVGQAAAPVGVEGCRVGECALGDFVAEALLHATHGAQVAVMNAGGIRTGLPGGTITLGDVLTALPFGNTVATMTLSGADLRAALLQGVARAGKGAFPQVAGMRLRPGGGIDVRQADGSFAPLDPARRYLVATNNFLRGGGDGYATFRSGAIDPYDTGPGLDEVVSRAIAAASPLAPATDGRIALR